MIKSLKDNKMETFYVASFILMAVLCLFSMFVGGETADKMYMIALGVYVFMSVTIITWVTLLSTGMAWRKMKSNHNN